MRENICQHELAVARAVSTGLWDSAVREHAVTCAPCLEVMSAASHLQSLADGQAAGIPDAAWLWRKALLEEKQAEADRAQRPFRVAQVVSIPALIVLASLLIAWGSTQLLSYLPVLGEPAPWWQLSPDWWSFVATPRVSPEGFSLVLLITVAALVVVGPLLAEE